jgi:hypothetical protein
MEAVRSFETYVNTSDFTWRINPEGLNLKNRMLWFHTKLTYLLLQTVICSELNIVHNYSKVPVDPPNVHQW